MTDLRTTATILREADDTAALERAYRAWPRGIGSNESFFTKWLAFAGVRPGRPWQPLILDRRVWCTLKSPLRVDLPQLAGITSQWVVYRTYVEMVHAWANERADARRLEWILFEQNGRSLTSDDLV